jgi:ribonucleoside-diphosphate reductase alpha chain
MWTHERASHRSSFGETFLAVDVIGYEGVTRGEGDNFTMVRNGTCLKCDTCGSTSACS